MTNMKAMFAPLINDGYKIGHVRQYPKGTQYIYSNFTPRSFRLSPLSAQVLKFTGMRDKVVVAGIQVLVKEFLIDNWNETFFSRPKETVVQEYEEFVKTFQGLQEFDVSHIAKLHELGYLPLRLKALPEGTISNVKVPILTLTNTHPDFAWLVGFMEDLVSNLVWKATTIATISQTYRRIMERFYDECGMKDKSFIDFQCHDFSLRGMSGPADAMYNGIGHLFSFMSSDNLPAIYMAKKLYNADGFVAGGVPATEHSVMSSYGKDGEMGCIEKLIELYPSGILSVVSDTYDYWNMVRPGGILAELKNQILSRDGKYVVRPDSGDPVDIICGTETIVVDDLLNFSVSCTVEELDLVVKQSQTVFNKKDGKYYIFVPNRGFVEVAATPELKGTIECLWDTFGGTTNEEGFRTLHEKVGVIYGDAITPDRCYQILERLEAKGFAPNNLVFGVGSYTMQYITRDSFGFAMKSTYAIIDGEPVNLIKDPKTGDGTKKSASGLLLVESSDEGPYLIENCSEEWERQGMLRNVFEDGQLNVDDSLESIRARLR